MPTQTWRRTVTAAMVAGIMSAGLTIGASPARADVIDDLRAEYDTGSSGGQISTLVHQVAKLRSQGFGPSKGNMADIQSGIDHRPNEMPLIKALQDTVAFQTRNKSRANATQPQNPGGIVIGGTPGGLPPGLVPGTGGSSISMGG